MKKHLKRIEDLKEGAIMKFINDGLYTKFLISKENSPMQDADLFGSWLLSFESPDLTKTWMEIYNAFRNYCESNIELTKVVQLNDFQLLDESNVCMVD